MNAKRREKIDVVIGLLGQAEGLLGEIQDEEQTAYENLPDSLFASERGSIMYEAIDNLESAVSSIREAVEFLKEAKG